MRRTKEDAEQTRQAILESAMDIFYEKGYSKTTFDEIAKRINLTKGAVYWYFRNKPDIVAALINDFVQKHIKRLEEFRAGKEEENLDILADMMLLAYHHMKKNPLEYKFIFFITCQMEWSEAILVKIRPLVEQTSEISRKLMTDTLLKLKKNKKIKEDTDVEKITEILQALWMGLLENYLAKRMTLDFEQIVRQGFNLIFNSIKTEGVNNEN
ncbi:MAG: TetR/AcrR family transcriptional regulator [Alphaproteobacteria bacterium]|nr:TetR/AcrR family transcriptional regulator [Alphaproteobacteria bacterium]MDY4689852.1 TetR/AcrR family transcriptional regulator [Alphaproteobacteria bacterium]